ncbi:MAG: YidC/Oxa1 family insertase periplasmic-domain containing protein [Candidatus Omnitrophica bacterium]|nr:YidC/Oxa1 family insertase periplasmic-domain containing protein [Candidatus Omnitrophota bacterium]
MKQEQSNLFLALTLTLGILLCWSLLFPTPQREEPNRDLTTEQVNQQVATVAIRSPEEKTQEILAGKFLLGFGLQKGGIKSISVGADRLLVNADPGLLAVVLKGQVSEAGSWSTVYEGGAFESRSEAKDGSYEIARSIRPSEGLSPHFLNVSLTIANRSDKTLSFQPEIAAYHPIYAENPMDRSYLHGFVSSGEKVHKIKVKVDGNLAFQGAPRWITSQGKTHLLILQPVKTEGVFHVEQLTRGTEQGWFEAPEESLLPGQSVQYRFRLYAGPIDIAALRQAGLEEAFSFGMMSGITKLLVGVLVWSEGWLKNYGLAIIFVSILIWVFFFPVSWSGIRMMKTMSVLQPQMAQLQKQFKENPQKLNQEMMALYRKHRVNPLGGCLPMLVQIPIFFCFYQALLRFPQLSGARFFLIEDLAKPDAIIRFKGALPLVGESINLLPFLMTAAMFVQQRLTTTTKPVTEEHAMQQKIFQFMPVIFCFFFYSLPSGLVLYWVTNTVLTITQYYAFNRVHRIQ